jgi:hypothetical protein
MRLMCGLAVYATLASVGVVAAQDKKDAVLEQKTGAVMLRTADGFKPQPQGAAVKPGDTLVALPDAVLKAKGGSVELHMVADIGNHGSFPVLESALTWGGDAGYDLDATLQRGVILLKAPRDKTKARIKFADQTWVFSFLQPDTMIAIESYGRIPPGTEALGKFMRDGFKGEAGNPNFEVVLLIVKGKAFVDFGTKGVALSAPPGPARAHWNNVTERVEVNSIDKLPTNVTQEPDAKVKEHVAKIRKAVDVLNQGVTTKQIAEGVLAKDAALPKLNVVLAGAMDNLDGLTLSLNAPRQDVREAGIRVLRHWLGREDGQVKRLHDYMVEKKQIKPAQARNFLQLLVGFDDRERGEPATYEMLIGLLTHPKLPVRELAHWHLVRLTPEGSKIPFDAAGSAAELEAAQRQWHVLVPEGKIPMPPQGETKNNAPEKN